MIQTDVLILGGLSGITAGISCRRHYPNKKVVLVARKAPSSSHVGFHISTGL